MDDCRGVLVGKRGKLGKRLSLCHAKNNTVVHVLKRAGFALNDDFFNAFFARKMDYRIMAEQIAQRSFAANIFWLTPKVVSVFQSDPGV